MIESDLKEDQFIARDANQMDLVCSEVAHVYEHWSELCKCGEQSRHRALKCEHCGCTYWTPRATNPKVEQEQVNG